MGCCKSDTRQPDTQVQIQEEKRLRSPNPHKETHETPKLVDGKLDKVLTDLPSFSSHTNIEKEFEKEIRLERLIEKEQYAEQYRCEFLFNYFLVENKEHYQSLRGSLYFFKEYLYFYCTTQIQVQPYGEFVRYQEIKSISLINRESDEVFSVAQKNGQKFYYRMIRDHDKVVEAFIALNNRLRHA